MSKFLPRDYAATMDLFQVYYNGEPVESAVAWRVKEADRDTISLTAHAANGNYLTIEGNRDAWLELFASLS